MGENCVGRRSLRAPLATLRMLPPCLRFSVRPPPLVVLEPKMGEYHVRGPCPALWEAALRLSCFGRQVAASVSASRHALHRMASGCGVVVREAFMARPLACMCDVCVVSPFLGRLLRLKVATSCPVACRPLVRLHIRLMVGCASDLVSLRLVRHW